MQEDVLTEPDFTTWRTADAGVDGEDEAPEEDETGEDVVVGQDAAAEERMEAVMSIMSSGILGLVSRQTVAIHTNKIVNVRGSLS